MDSIVPPSRNHDFLKEFFGEGRDETSSSTSSGVNLQIVPPLPISGLRHSLVCLVGLLCLVDRIHLIDERRTRVVIIL